MKSSTPNRHAVVTGAGSGVGECVAEGLAREGMPVVLAGRRAEKLERVAAAISANGGEAHVAPGDVSLREDVERIHEVSASLGVCGVLVNAAGVHGEMALIQDSDPDGWMKTMAINAFGPYLTCRYYVKEMLNAGWGRIINITSASSLGTPGGLGSAYPLSKVTLNHFTRQLAAEVAGTGVTANVIHPGEVKTPMWQDIKSSAHALGRLGEGPRGWAKLVEETGGDPPEKTLDIVLRLVEEDSETNGQFLWIEGGLQDPKPTW